MCRAGEHVLNFIPSNDCSKDGTRKFKNIQGSPESLAAPLISFHSRGCLLLVEVPCTGTNRFKSGCSQPHS